MPQYCSDNALFGHATAVLCAVLRAFSASFLLSLFFPDVTSGIVALKFFFFGSTFLLALNFGRPATSLLLETVIAALESKWSQA